jgi:hypothetical protein
MNGRRTFYRNGLRAYRRIVVFHRFSTMETPMISTGRICFAAMLVVTVAYGSRSQAADSVVGSWRLASWAEVETESKVVRTPFGENPSGVITYTPDGRMSVLIIDSKRKSPAGPKATDAEGVELYQTMIAYSGAYSLDGNKVTHKIEVSWNQAWTGTNQQRFFEVKDDILTIKTPQIISPITGKESVSTLVWERVK